MELPNRMALESSFAKRLSRLSSSHRDELRELMGSPPNASNVPASFWEKVKRETEENTAVALYLLFIASAYYHASGSTSGKGLHSATALLLNRQADVYAQRRASDLASSYASTSMDRFSTLKDRLSTLETPPTRNEIEADLTKIFGPKRDAGVAASETTAAQSAGGDAGIEGTVGVSQQDLWINKNPRPNTICPICKALHRSPRSEWEKQFPSGPPAHPVCYCEIEYANKDLGGAAA